MTDDDLLTLLALGHETHGVEFKGAGKRSDPGFRAEVVRAVLGMANRRDGGMVIIGIHADTLEPEGLTDEQAESWAYDHLSPAINEFASPSVGFEVERRALNQKTLIVIHVHEFADIPILCTKDYQRTNVKKAAPILRRGACYVRSRHKPETSEIPSEEEMRELLELAIDKGVRKFVARAQAAGMFPTSPAPRPVSEGEAQFRKQIEEMG